MCSVSERCSANLVNVPMLALALTISLVLGFSRLLLIRASLSDYPLKISFFLRFCSFSVTRYPSHYEGSAMRVLSRFGCKSRDNQFVEKNTAGNLLFSDWL